MISSVLTVGFFTNRVVSQNLKCYFIRNKNKTEQVLSTWESEKARMKMQLSELTTEHKWRAATGLNKERFYKLLERVKVAYETQYKKSIEPKQEAEKHFDFGISNEKELLYFTLFSLKF